MKRRKTNKTQWVFEIFEHLPATNVKPIVNSDSVWRHTSFPYYALYLHIMKFVHLKFNQYQRKKKEYLSRSSSTFHSLDQVSQIQDILESHFFFVLEKPKAIRQIDVVWISWKIILNTDLNLKKAKLKFTV